MSDDHDTPDAWLPEQKALFTRLLRYMEQTQSSFTHPKAAPIPAEHWSTIAWNAAWVAAHMIGDDAGPFVHVDEDGNVLGEEHGTEAFQ